MHNLKSISERHAKTETHIGQYNVKSVSSKSFVLNTRFRIIFKRHNYFRISYYFVIPLLKCYAQTGFCTLGLAEVDFCFSKLLPISVLDNSLSIISM